MINPDGMKRMMELLCQEWLTGISETKRRQMNVLWRIQEGVFCYE